MSSSPDMLSGSVPKSWPSQPFDLQRPPLLRAGVNEGTGSPQPS